ncbi:MAG: uracil-DNA glycosylase [Oscillospiraceae bacterium]|nr:uracil-DNA glycosylase [Oscillospiraceae bacterium]
MNNDSNEKVNCFQCVHYTVTWEPKFPRSCKLFGFKSAQMPSLAVLKSSGAPCEGFERKN